MDEEETLVITVKKAKALWGEDFGQAPGPPVRFTEHAEGAFPNGARVTKTERKEGDAHGPGDLATVLGSLGPIAVKGGPSDGTKMYGYFVEWDDQPGLPVFVSGSRIQEAK